MLLKPPFYQSFILQGTPDEQQEYLKKAVPDSSVRFLQCSLADLYLPFMGYGLVTRLYENAQSQKPSLIHISQADAAMDLNNLLNIGVHQTLLNVISSDKPLKGLMTCIGISTDTKIGYKFKLKHHPELILHAQGEPSEFLKMTLRYSLVDGGF